MVSRTNLNLHPAEQGRCDSLHLFTPQKDPFFDAKPKCDSKCGQNLRPTRINTGVSADFRLQPQKPRFCTWVTGDLPEFSPRRKSACSPVFMRVGSTFGRKLALHLDLGSKKGYVSGPESRPVQASMMMIPCVV